MSKEPTKREFADANGITSRTARLFRTVANELERLGVRWNSVEEESVTYMDWANWMGLSPTDAEYRAVELKGPRGIHGCLFVHQAVFEG
jgi:hypothetical protein